MLGIDIWKQCEPTSDDSEPSAPFANVHMLMVPKYTEWTGIATGCPSPLYPAIDQLQKHVFSDGGHTMVMPFEFERFYLLFKSMCG